MPKSQTKHIRRSSFVELCKGRWREFRREPSAFFFVLLMPILWMVLLGYGLSGDRQDVYGVGWVDASDAKETYEALAIDPRIRVTTAEAGDLETRLKRGEILILIEATPTGIRFVYDPANRESRLARDVANDVVQRAGGRRDSVLVEDQPIKIAGTRYVDFLVPGLLALTILSTSLFGTGMTLVANRRDGLLKRYLATPLKPYEYILSHVVGRGFILAFEIVTVLLAAGVIFHFRIAGRFVDFLAVAVLGAASLTSLGILVGSRTTNAGAMNGIANLLMLPMMILSGIWFSRTNLPEWLAEASRWLPLTALVDGLRRIALEGASLANLTFELGVLGASFVICTIAARSLFKWY